MIKRIVSLLLACILVLALTACGDSADTASKTATASTASKTASVAQSNATASTADGKETVADPVRPTGKETNPYVGTAKASWTASSAITLEQDGVKMDMFNEAMRTFLSTNLAMKTIDYSDASKDTISAQSPRSYNFSWKVSGITVTSATAYFSTNADLSDPVSVKASGNTASVYNLKPSTRYFWWVEAQTASGVEKSNVATVDIEAGPYLLKVEGGSNVRDIGGWETLDGRKIKYGLVLRSARFDSINANGKSAMNAYGVKTDLDLRKDTELSQMPVLGQSPIGSHVKYIRNSGSAYDGFICGADVLTTMRVFADLDNYPIVFHCASGADRTGSVALALEALCNCNEATIVTDYELTGGRNRTKLASTMTKFKKETGDTLQQKMQNMLYHLGMTRMEVSNIYNILMTDSGIFASESLSKAKDVDGKKAFTLNLRQSGGVEYVSVGGYKVDWTLDGNTLTVDATEGNGFIVFKDGDFLEFSL